MSEQLTDFEAYIYHRNDSDVTFDLDNQDLGISMFSLMDAMQEAFKTEYDELTDKCCNALDVSERIESIHNRTTQKQLRSDEQVISKVIQEFAQEALKEAIYKLEGQDERCDIRAAKVYREIQGMV